MTILPAAALAVLLLTACTSDKMLRDEPPHGGASVTGSVIRTIEIGGKAHQVQWIEYEMDFFAMMKGERGLLAVEQDPWTGIPFPPGTIASVEGFVLVTPDGQMDMTGKIVSWENRDLQLDGGSGNLPYRCTREIPSWRLPFGYNFRPYDTIAGSRIRTPLLDSETTVGTTTTRVASKLRGAAATGTVNVMPAPPKYFLDGERYVFCAKHDIDGEITSWIGDVLAVIHIVPTYRIAAPNPVLAVTVENLLGFRTAVADKPENEVLFEINEIGKEFSWRYSGSSRAYNIDNNTVQKLTYALNGIVWEKLPEATNAGGATQRWHYVIHYRVGGEIKSATLSPLANASGCILESPELGRWKGEDWGAITTAIQMFGPLNP